MRRLNSKFLCLIGLLLLVLGCSSTPTEPLREPSSLPPGQWPQWSGDLQNHHDATTATTRLNVTNVSQLVPVWKFDAQNSISDTPTVDGDVVYFNSLAKTNLIGLLSYGELFAVNKNTGKKIWSNSMSHYTGSTLRNFSRSSPAISGDTLVIGDSVNNLKYVAQSLLLGTFKTQGSLVIAIDKRSGKKIWSTFVDKHIASRITMSPVIFEGRVYVGVSSLESELPAIPISGLFYKCCTFKGSLVSLDLKTGKILWQTYTIDPDLKEFSGAPVWGNSPPIDPIKRRIYIGTGNNYQATTKFSDCIKQNQNSNTPPSQDVISQCARLSDSTNNRFDSIMALDLDTGKIIWTKKTLLYDAWNAGCGADFIKFPPKNLRTCPNIVGADGDFAQAPMLINLQDEHKQVLLAGQKNGMVWALDTDNGAVVWAKQVGPGGKLGGHQWGAATDGRRAFFQTTNMEHRSVDLLMADGTQKKTTGGFWTALDVKTGQILWQTEDPNSNLPLKGEGISHILYGSNLGRGFFASAMGPLTYINGVVFAGSLAGEMLALNASNGSIIWRYKTKGSVVSAPSIVNDQLFWGAGYHMGFAGTELISFKLSN